MYANRRYFRALKEIGDVRFYTGSKNMAVSRMHDENMHYNHYLTAESPKFL